MVRRSVFAMLVVAVACRPTPASSDPAASVAASAPAPAVVAPPPIPDGPVLVVRNRSDTAIEIYGAYIVDRSGELGTRSLWPDKSDCPDVSLPPRSVDAGGVLLLPPPREVYVDSCAPVALPHGDYVVRLDSGHGEQLYAAAPITLPVTQPVELELKNHDAGPKCDAALARRAARLAFAAAGPLPNAWARECDVARAGCGTLPLESTLPPKKCTITLHEHLLRVERAPSRDTPRTIEAWMDSEVVYVQSVDVTRTSASRVEVGGKRVVIAGETSEHLHEHGGAAATIGAARFTAYNPHGRALRLRVRGVEFLEDSECELPSEVSARPELDPDTPTRLPPGESELVVGFAAQGAYQVSCDRFATRVTFEVEGKRIVVTTEHEVMRVEPMRE